MSTKGSGKRYGSISPQYVRKYSPPGHKTSQDIFKKYAKNNQDPTRILFNQKEEKNRKVDGQDCN